jgi:LAO/AO transport system kinase
VAAEAVGLDAWEARFRARDPRALARAISWIEDRDPRGEELAGRLVDRPQGAWVIGLTGPPGVGKSSLVERLALRLLDQGRRVGVLAVDPTSPFSGGAVLGDRIRMRETVVRAGAFVRSMGTRGALGGLAAATPAVIRLLDLYGHDVVLVETVGVGQSEVEIVKSADTSVVIEAPGLGDSVQAIKAGILEIGDLFVVNKADRPGAQRAALEIEPMLSLGLEHLEWVPPVVLTAATDGTGMDEFLAALERHHAYLAEDGRLDRARARRRSAHFWSAVTARLEAAAREFMAGEDAAQVLAQVESGSVGPEQAARWLSADFSLAPGGASEAEGAC